METTSCQCDCKWADLPEDLLWRVSKLLPIRCYIRSRAVCSWWRAAIPAKPGLPHAPPWLLLPGEHGADSESCSFLSVPAGRAIQYPLPQLRGMRCVGSHDEWLAVADLSLNACLLNPFTGAQIHLPAMTTLPGVEAIYTGSGGSLSGFLLHDSRFEEPRYYSLDRFRDWRIQKIVFTPNPKPHDYVAFVICSFLGLPVAYTKAGSTKWEIMKDSDVERKNPIFVNDIVHRDGKFYGVGIDAEVLIFDLSYTSPKVTIFSEGIYHGIVRSTNEYMPDLLGIDKFVVLSNDNTVYQVWRKSYALNLRGNEDVDIVVVDEIDVDVEDDDEFDFDGINFDENIDYYRYVTKEIIVLQHDPECRPCWREVRELQGQCILIGNNQTVSIQAAPDMLGLRANCIYFTDDCFEFGETYIRRQIRDVGVFDLEKQTVELCYPPNSHLSWPPPIWFLLFMK